MASVLVVDDEPDLRYLAQINLEMDGHRVMTAANGEEALAAVQVECPDVVLLDVMMPGVDGWSVLRQIKSHLDERVASVRVLMMTALGEDGDRLRGGIEGAVQYLVKPVAPEVLRAAVHDILAGAPEPEQRRRTQTDALVELARRDGGRALDPNQPRPRLGGLEHLRTRSEQPSADDDGSIISAPLTQKQRDLLAVLTATPSVSEAALQLGVSRSNVYASLRRIARKIDVDSVPDLLRSLRAGDVRVAPE